MKLDRDSCCDDRVQEKIVLLRSTFHDVSMADKKNNRSSSTENELEALIVRLARVSRTFEDVRKTPLGRDKV
jgi:hypothetical protein